MKEEKLFQAITDLDAKLVAEAEPKKRKPPRWVSAVAAVLVVAILVGIVLRPERSTFALAMAEYPQMAQYPANEMMNGNLEAKAYEAWAKDREARIECASQYDVCDFGSFFTRFASQFMTEKTQENVVFSPINIYIALAMLAETTDGNSRQQLLELLDAANIETLRARVSAMWQANYINDGAMSKVLANSLWLDEALDYKQETINTLADDYRASVFQGAMDDAAYSKALRDWLSEQTNELLSTGDVPPFDENAVLALASTIYFRAKWAEPFELHATEASTFHSPSGDIICDFLNQEIDGSYYSGSSFTAIQKAFSDNENKMWLLLPNENVTCADILQGGEWFDLLVRKDSIARDFAEITLSVPKFDVSTSTSLIDGLAALGVTDILSSDTANFSPITTTDDAYLSNAQHNVRVAINEEGCTAAAYTLMELSAEGFTENHINFTLDRPFLFILTASDNTPTFIGIVNNPIA